MKKILLLILLIPNLAFAEDFSLFRLFTQNTRPNLDKDYSLLSFMDKGKMNCEIHQKASKENNFIESQICLAKASDAYCLVLIDKRKDQNHKPLPQENYCYSKLELIAANNLF